MMSAAGQWCILGRSLPVEAEQLLVASFGHEEALIGERRDTLSLVRPEQACLRGHPARGVLTARPRPSPRSLPLPLPLPRVQEGIVAQQGQERGVAEGVGRVVGGSVLTARAVSGCGSGVGASGRGGGSAAGGGHCLVRRRRGTIISISCLLSARQGSLLLDFVRVGVLVQLQEAAAAVRMAHHVNQTLLLCPAGGERQLLQ